MLFYKGHQQIMVLSGVL